MVDIKSQYGRQNKTNKRKCGQNAPEMRKNRQQNKLNKQKCGQHPPKTSKIWRQK